jgi:hypothetical protein
MPNTTQTNKQTQNVKVIINGSVDPPKKKRRPRKKQTSQGGDGDFLPQQQSAPYVPYMFPSNPNINITGIQPYNVVPQTYTPTTELIKPESSSVAAVPEYFEKARTNLDNTVAEMREAYQKELNDIKQFQQMFYNRYLEDAQNSDETPRMWPDNPLYSQPSLESLNPIPELPEPASPPEVRVPIISLMDDSPEITATSLVSPESSPVTPPARPLFESAESPASFSFDRGNNLRRRPPLFPRDDSANYQQYQEPVTPTLLNFNDAGASTSRSPSRNESAEASSPLKPNSPLSQATEAYEKTLAYGTIGIGKAELRRIATEYYDFTPRVRDEPIEILQKIRELEKGKKNT